MRASLPLGIALFFGYSNALEGREQRRGALGRGLEHKQRPLDDRLGSMCHRNVVSSLPSGGAHPGRLQQLKLAAKDLVTVYGPIAIIFDIISLQFLGVAVFTLLTLKIINPPQFIAKKVAGKQLAKHGLNAAMTVAICETILAPLRLVWAVYMTPKVAKLLPQKWQPKSLRTHTSK